MMYNTDFVLNLFQEFFLRQVHNLVADFIVQMPLKVFPSFFFVQFYIFAQYKITYSCS